MAMMSSQILSHAGPQMSPPMSPQTSPHMGVHLGAQQQMNSQVSQASPQSLVEGINQLDEDTASHVLCMALQQRPQLAPKVVDFAVPEYTYPPAKALGSRRSSGVITFFDQSSGYGVIECETLNAVFGTDVCVHKKQLGTFAPNAKVTFAVALTAEQTPQAYDLQPIEGSSSTHSVADGSGSTLAAMADGNQQQQQQQWNDIGNWDCDSPSAKRMRVGCGEGCMDGMGGPCSSGGCGGGGFGTSGGLGGSSCLMGGTGNGSGMGYGMSGNSSASGGKGMGSAWGNGMVGGNWKGKGNWGGGGWGGEGGNWTSNMDNWGGCGSGGMNSGSMGGGESGPCSDMPAFANADGTISGEVRFETEEEARHALPLLDGSEIQGMKIAVSLDHSARNATKLFITGLPAGMHWQALKEHCLQAGGKIAFVAVQGGKGKGGPSGSCFNHGPGLTFGEVRFESAEHARNAMQVMNGSRLGGSQIWIQPDPYSKDSAKLIVHDIPTTVMWQELKDHFSQCGPVAFANVHNPFKGGKKGSFCDKGFDHRYDKGYGKGYDKGGYDKGYCKGYDRCFDKGYDKGYGHHGGYSYGGGMKGGW